MKKKSMPFFTISYLINRGDAYATLKRKSKRNRLKHILWCLDNEATIIAASSFLATHFKKELLAIEYANKLNLKDNEKLLDSALLFLNKSLKQQH